MTNTKTKGSGAPTSPHVSQVIEIINHMLDANAKQINAHRENWGETGDYMAGLHDGEYLGLLTVKQTLMAIQAGSGVRV